MKAAVFGYHPDVFPGFNALMTANLVYGLAQEGCEVTILMPNTASHPQFEVLNQKGLTVEALDRFGADFEIQVVSEGQTIGSFDLCIWQSYFSDDEAFFDDVRSGARILAKNFPRLLVGERDRDTKMLAGSANRFDLVGLALKADHRIAISLQDVIPEHVSRTFYMPRGFRPDWFIQPSCDGSPIFGFEKGVDVNSNEYEYLIPVIAELRRIYGEVRVIGARVRDERITTSTLGLLPARDFYSSFINPLWAYLMIDVNRSRQSINAINVDGRKVYPGLYENQVVEAQMAGAAVVGHADALPEELIGSKRTGLQFQEFSKSDVIINFLCNVIDNREAIATEARAWAIKNHSVGNMIKPLLEAIR